MLDKTDGRVLAGDWTEDRVKVLEQRWSEGKSATQIADELGGVSRGAVLGKIHRCGFKAPADKAAIAALRPKRTPGWKPVRWRQPMSREERLRRRREREELNRLTRPQSLPPTVTAPSFLNLTFDQLTFWTCHYPIGDGPPFLFCGQPVVKDSYCAHCFAITHAPRRAA